MTTFCLVQKFAAAVANSQLSAVSVAVLARLVDAGDGPPEQLTATPIANACGLNNSTVGRTLADLQRRGFVDRDTQRTPWRATAAGREELQKVTRAVRAAIQG